MSRAVAPLHRYEWQYEGKVCWLLDRGRLIGCWNAETKTWWKWDGTSYAQAERPDWK